MTKYDLTGKKVHKLTVIEPVIQGKGIVWKCLCECGNEVYKKGYILKRFAVKSCGCGRSDGVRTSNTKHGMNGTRFHRIWLGMKSRCFTPSATNYNKYGGKGIKVCESWLVFENFKSDMYDKYVEHSKLNGESDTTLDRIDPTGDYKPENCHWATREIQTKNRAVTKYYEYQGKSYTIRELSERFGFTASRIKNRLKMGWSMDDALTTEVKKGNRYMNIKKQKNIGSRDSMKTIQNRSGQA